MDTAEVPVDKRVPGLGLVIRTVSEPEMPLGVFLPRVRLQEGVLLAGVRLDFAPVAVEDVLAAVDELLRMRHSAGVHGVRSHHSILPGGDRGCCARIRAHAWAGSYRVLAACGLVSRYGRISSRDRGREPDGADLQSGPCVFPGPG